MSRVFCFLRPLTSISKRQHQSMASRLPSLTSGHRMFSSGRDHQKSPMVISLEEKQILLQPYDYILKCSGKQFRSKLIYAFNHWMTVPDDILIVIGDIVNMLHNASLLVDDIEDNSVLRRGLPVAHHIFGVASTINTSNYVYFLALEKAIKNLPRDVTIEAVRIFTEQLLELHQGQGLDIHWRDTFKCPTENEYLTMIKMKTGGLFGLGVRLMQLFSDGERDFLPLMQLLGVYFQIRDDYANLKSGEYAENKSYCEDLTEGKFSFPIVHAIRMKPDDPTLMNIIRQRTTSVELKKFAIEVMERSGSFDYTRTVLEEYEVKLRTEIDQLGGNQQLVQLIDVLRKVVS